MTDDSIKLITSKITKAMKLRPLKLKVQCNTKLWSNPKKDTAYFYSITL